MTTPTFEINRSNVLRALLQYKGFREANYDETPNFSYCTRPEGNVRNLPVTVTRTFCTKRRFYQLLKRHQCIDDLPTTYLSVRDLPTDTSDDVWFVKESVGSRGEAVYCFRDLASLQEKVDSLKPLSFVIQKGVSRLDLLDNRKYTLRVYLLHLQDGRVFVYNRIVCIQHRLPFDPTSCDHEVHVNHKEADRFDLEETHPHFDLIFDRIVEVCARNFACFRKDINMKHTDYHLYGLDFLIDQDLRPWFIEMNGFPNVGSTVDDPREGILVDLFTDFYHLVVAPKLFGASEEVRNFVPCLPTLKN